MADYSGDIFPKELVIKKIALFLSYTVLLIASTTLGILGKPTEMGLAILAGALGLAFSNIEKISRFKGAGFEAEMRKVETIIDNQTEPTPQQKEKAQEIGNLHEIEIQVLETLQGSNYTWRYASTIANILVRSEQDIQETLRSMMKRGLVKNGQGSNREIWATTVIGKSALEQCRIGNT